MKKIAFYITLGAIIYILTFVINFPDWDLWARLAVGSIFFQTGHVLKQDIFAYTQTKPVWVDHEWGSGVIFYWVLKHFGEWGFFALKAALLLIIFLLMVRIIRLNIPKEQNIEISYFVLVAFGIAVNLLNLIRSQTFTFIFFVLWLYILERSRRGDNKLLWLMPATAVLWANLHGGFVAGIGLLLIYAVGEYSNKKSFLKYIYMLFPTLLATLINPYGFKYWHYIIEATTMSRSAIREWQPVDFIHSTSHIILGVPIPVHLGFLIFLLLTAAVAVRLMFIGTKPDWVKIILVSVFIYIGIQHQRHTSFFILAGTSMLYNQYVELFGFIGRFIRNKYGDKIAHYAVTAKDGLSYAAILSFCMFVIPTLPTKIIVQPTIYPIGSLEFIKQNDLKGNLAITYNWGSYALWKLYPQCKVLIDGRYEEVYPDDVFKVALNFSGHINDRWTDALKLYHTDIIVAPKREYRPNDLMQLKGWQMVYEDELSVVLLPKDKLKETFIYPNYKNKVYWNEDLTRNIPIKTADY